MMLHDDGPMQVQPEFSLRILDDTYAKQNRTIAAIQVGKQTTCGKRSAFLAPEPSSRRLPVFPVGADSAPASARLLRLRNLPLVQDVLAAYYQRRPGRLAQEGLAGLRSSMAGIYYVPFVTGVSMHFRFAGQSIPTRRGDAGEEWQAGRAGQVVLWRPVHHGRREAGQPCHVRWQLSSLPAGMDPSY